MKVLFLVIGFVLGYLACSFVAYMRHIMAYKGRANEIYKQKENETHWGAKDNSNKRKDV